MNAAAVSVSTALILILPACATRTSLSEQDTIRCIDKVSQLNPYRQPDKNRMYAACLRAARSQKTTAPSTKTQTPSPTLPPVPVRADSLPSPSERYYYCRIYQNQIIAAEGRRIAALGPWMVATKKYDPSSFEYKAASREYKEAVAELERLIPPEMRRDTELVPHAVALFSRCRRVDFLGS